VPAGTQEQRNLALDGLRGFAALAVLSSHLVASVGLLPFQTGGFIGVLVFFVLSGYLITTICWRVSPTRQAYARFLRRRVQRLAGVLVALVVVGIPVMVAWGGQAPADALVSGALALGQLTAFAVTMGVGEHPAWGPTWSLTVEWVFYLLMPLAIMGFKRRRVSLPVARNFVARTAVGLYLAGLLLPDKAFYLLPVANLGVMAAGAWLALAHLHEGPLGERRAPDPARAVFALVLLILFVVIPQGQLGVGYQVVVMPSVTVATLVVLHGCRDGAAVARLLAARPLTAVGRRAYSLYLWHFMVFWVVWMHLQDSPTLVQASAMVGVTAVVVAVSFHFLERPWLTSGRGRRVGGPSRDALMGSPASAS
jgi:peptidoglycan/LPS O-acetylase OafA/YrhL